MMTDLNVAVIYDSSTGGNVALAKTAVEAAEEVGANVKLAKVPKIAPKSDIVPNPAWDQNQEATKDIPEAQVDDLLWADAFIFSMPTRFGNVSAHMKQFLDQFGPAWGEGKLVNKVVSAMTSAQNPHGGQEQTIRAFYATMMHWGAIIANPGYTDGSIFAAGGNPYGTSVTIDPQGNWAEDVTDAVKHQAKRTIQVGKWVKQGQEAES